MKFQEIFNILLILELTNVIVAFKGYCRLKCAVTTLLLSKNDPSVAGADATFHRSQTKKTKPGFYLKQHSELF